MKVGPLPGDSQPSRIPAHHLTLRNGQTLDLYVEGRAGRSVVVRIAGRRLTAAFEGEVRPGKWYRVEVLRTGRTTVFRTLDRAPVPLDARALAARSGLRGPHAEDVVRAFVRSSLPLQPEALQRAYRRVNSSTRLSAAERARLAAVLEEKGLLSETVWDRALEALAGGADEGSGDGERHGGDHEERPGVGEGGARDEERDAEVDALRRSLESSIRGEGATSDLLALVNHTPGREGTWMIVPLEFENSPAFTAALKIWVPPGRDALPTSSAANDAGESRQTILDVRDGDERWTFALQCRGGTGDEIEVVALAAPERSTVARDDSSARSSSRWLELSDRLERAGIRFRPGSMSKDSNDGFSTHDDPAIIRSVDSRV